MKKILLTVGALFLLSACSTLKVETDYDPKYNFNDKLKYNVLHSDRTGGNSLVNDRITDAIQNSLNAKKYKEVAQKEADLLFVFHVNVQKMSDIRTDYQRVGYPGYGYGAFGYGYGSGGTMVVARPSTYKWTEGKLIIDVLNPKTKKIVWRGIVTDELSSSNSTPQEKTKYINKVVSKLMDKFFNRSK